MSPLRTAAVLAACLCVAFAAPVEDVPTPLADEDYRLPLTILPSNYKISLTPFLREGDDQRFTFEGDVQIQITPSQTTRTLIMHSKRLIYAVREYWNVNTPATKIALPTTWELNDVTDKITYTLTQDLVQGQTYILHFVYSGLMEDDMHGFYRSSYINDKNETKWIGSTQFQPNHARRAFPSFDEPKFKATFDVTIKHHRSMKSFGNTRIISTTLDGEMLTDVYATTPKMSTYLLAFIVSEFNERYNGEFGVIARPEYYAQTEYSFEVGQKLLNELDKYLDYKYYTMGVNKMHLAAIPDFSAGAMENWGLLTFRERGVLYENGSSTLSSKQYIAAVIAHEQAHMWFGDLVTCDWWSYTWLNEGFARYFQYFGTAMVESYFELEKQFPVDQVQSVMGMDSTSSTNPMSDPNTHSPADISRMFNSISYNKGASVIRMIKHVIGESNFQKTLREYLKKHNYENTVPQNLLDAWKLNWPAEFATYADPLFKSFTEQVGYPVVKIVTADDDKSFKIAQKRFLLKSDGSDSSLLYTVPITYTTSNENDFNATKPKFFLEANADNKTITLSSNVSWVIANIQETGYYRVNYDEKNWHRIHHALLAANWSNIHELNRAQIVDDLLNFARAGEVTYELALAVLEYLETETTYLPWKSAFNGFTYLLIRLGRNTFSFSQYIKTLTEKSYKFLGFEERPEDSTLDIYNRAQILAWTCKFGNRDCITKANKYFNDFKNTPVPVNIRSVVYCTAMREGNDTEFTALFNKYKTETVATEETLILSSLGCVKDEIMIKRYFDIIVSNEVRRQDKSAALTSLYTENNENVQPVFDLVTKDFEKLAESLGSYQAVATVISNIASRFTEEGQKSQLVTFNQQNKAKFGSAAATLEAAEKTVDENLKWAADKLGTFVSYLEKYNKDSGASLNTITTFTFVLMVIVAVLLR